MTTKPQRRLQPLIFSTPLPEGDFSFGLEVSVREQDSNYPDIGWVSHGWCFTLCIVFWQTSYSIGFSWDDTKKYYPTSNG